MCERVVCVREFCVSKLCVKELCVRELAGHGGRSGRRKERTGAHNQKQEPHPHKDVGKKPKTPQEHFAVVARSTLASQKC